MGTCTCKLCVEHKRFFQIIDTIPSADDREWIKTVYEQIDDERQDANYNQAIIDGSWPSADEVILHIRNTKKKQTK